MFKKLIALLMSCCAAIAMAAVDVNKASQAELTEVKGIGTAMATRILDARKQGTFKNWEDLIARVKGIAGASAGKLSEAGLTVNGQPYGKSDKAAPKASNPTEKSAKPAQGTGKKPEKS